MSINWGAWRSLPTWARLTAIVVVLCLVAYALGNVRRAVAGGDRLTGVGSESQNGAGSTNGGRDPGESDTRPLTVVLQDLERLQAQLPRDRVDPAAVVGAGRDPLQLLRWVRENTQPVTYEGALRGPLGVLMDRRGNSLDRALLLSRLLEIAGYKTRVVGATLTGDDPSNSTRRSASAVRNSPVSQPDDELARRAGALASTIAASIGKLTQALPSPESIYYWVQFGDGEHWTDADPALEEIGRARPHGDEKVLAVDQNTHGLADAADLTHSVMMRLVVERWESGRLVESPLSSFLFDQSAGPLPAMSLAFMPVQKDGRGLVQRVFATGTELRQTLLSETAWAPIIRDNNSGWRMGRMFDDAGIVRDIPGTGGADRMRDAASSAMGGLLSFGGDEPGPTVLTALMADYELRGPGAARRVIRRFIFDSIGPEVRRATEQIPQPAWTEQQRAERGADLAALNDTLVAFASLPADAYVSRRIQSVVEAKDAILRMDAGSTDDATLDQAENGLSLRTLELFAATRDATMSPNLAVTEPQIYRRIIRCAPDATTAGLRVQVLSDLAWNRLGTAGLAQDAGAVAYQGVLDTLQESSIVLRDESASPEHTTPALLEAAVKQGIESVALRSAADPRLAGYAPAARARMVADLEAGYVLVGPGRPVMLDGQPRMAWWRIDPHGGHTVGAFDTGLLQGDTEYAKTEEVNGIKIVRFKKPPPKPGPAARAYVRDLARRKPGISDDALEDIAVSVQRFILKTGSLPL